MERLTIGYCDEYVPKDLCNIDRLGRADDCDLCSEYCKATEEGNEDCRGCAINQCFNKLGEYENLEEQGKLLKLPCAVGDTVYYRYDGIKIAPMRVEQIIIAQYGIALLLEYFGNNEKLKCWRINIESSAFDCKIISLTREEAEAALSKADK